VGDGVAVELAVLELVTVAVNVRVTVAEYVALAAGEAVKLRVTVGVLVPVAAGLAV
jgi:hypothetical protein